MSIVNQAQRVFGACAVLLTAAGVLSACSDDESESVTLTLLTPEDGQVLTAEDDSDGDEPGVQLDITGKSTGLRAETPIELYVDDEPQGATGDVGRGNVTMDGHLPPGETRSTSATRSARCRETRALVQAARSVIQLRKR